MTDLERKIAGPSRPAATSSSIGGLTLSLAAIVAACGDDIREAPTRAASASLPRSPNRRSTRSTMRPCSARRSSIEQTTLLLYEAILDLGVLDEAGTALVGQLLESHRALDKVMGELTVAAGGEVWPCTNPWIEERFLVPITDAIKASDNQIRDIYNVAVSLENPFALCYLTINEVVDYSKNDKT